MGTVIRTATVNWEIRELTSVNEFLDHLTLLLDRCSDANLIVLPECFSLELLSLDPTLEGSRVPTHLAKTFESIVEVLSSFARRSQAIVVGGSHFRQVPEGIHNVCPVCMPSGDVRFQAKNKLTAYEREEWGLTPGRGLQSPFHQVGLSICYDSEFPEGPRLLAEAGMLVHCVPAYTETQRGFQRVRWCCLARAVENQTYVVHSSLVGSLGREPVPSAVGTSAVIAPSVEPFVERAVLAETGPGEGVAVADLDLDALLAARESGDVRNWTDRDGSNWFLMEP
ncbi:MAG TPA: nitrilase-related carbon-nitrogen hydrolase [Fimbriimonadaceae bacterium]|nr:nitrilase-related carbon-nitrogen hydrolase [Fimbriimonadaceae bacterium]